MRLANVGGRGMLLVSQTQAVDVEAESHGHFGPGIPGILERWADFASWAANVQPARPPVPIEHRLLGPPSPAPRQVFGIGFNYRDHVDETGIEPSEFPAVFTKFPSSISAPYSTVMLLPDGQTDWEVELVVIMGQRTSSVSATAAWEHVAGVCVGQDLSERVRQFKGTMPQFNLGKSAAGFGPIGPWLVTVDELANPDDIELGCTVNGSVVQQARTSSLIWSVPRLIAELSDLVTFLPGDLIFTGTPAGTGFGRRPPRYLQDGDILRSWVDGVGAIEQTFTLRDRRRTS